MAPRSQERRDRMGVGLLRGWPRTWILKKKPRVIHYLHENSIFQTRVSSETVQHSQGQHKFKADKIPVLRKEVDTLLRAASKSLL